MEEEEEEEEAEEEEEEQQQQIGNAKCMNLIGTKDGIINISSNQDLLLMRMATTMVGLVGPLGT